MIVVMNTATSALWLYANYPYNAFTEFAGKYLATGAAGVVQLDVGGLDDTVPIAAEFSLGKLALAKDSIGRVDAVYVSGTLGDDMLLTMTADAGASYEYTLRPTQADALMASRVKLGKGARGRYWRAQFANVAGGDFHIDTITMDTVQTARRV